LPELPEVETVCRRLRSRIAGRIVQEARIERPQIAGKTQCEPLTRALRARRIAGVERRAKNVLIRLSGDATLRVHLGMTGNLLMANSGDRPEATRAWFSLDDGMDLVLDDPRCLSRLQLFTPAEWAAIDQSLGIEPLTPQFTPQWLWAASKRRRKPAKLFLLDQSIVAGLGNIWAAEALFAARIHPAAPMNGLSRRRVGILHRAIVDTLSRAVQSAYSDYSAPRRTLESEGHGVSVYNRLGQPCHRCGRAIERLSQGGRSTYFCGKCQR
jgi:formamidopyrimidine-DNA glycosylase